MSKLISKLPKPIAKAVATGAHTLKKAAPDIFVVLGIGLVIGATITACKRSPEAKDILEKHNEKREEMGERTKENSKEVGALYKDTTVKLAKVYTAPTAVMGAGIAFIFYSHHILKQRNAALLSAYASLDAAFKAYRDRVMRENDISESKDEDQPKTPTETHFVDGIEVDENGIPIGAVAMDPNSINPYAVIFGPTNKNWVNNPFYNYQWLLGVEAMAQKKYYDIGHVFWNEILDGLDIPRTSSGALMGWKEGISDGKIDLGVKCPENVELADWIPRFERPFIINPNLRDVIWDKIRPKKR